MIDSDDESRRSKILCHAPSGVFHVNSVAQSLVTDFLKRAQEVYVFPDEYQVFPSLGSSVLEKKLVTYCSFEHVAASRGLRHLNVLDADECIIDREVRSSHALVACVVHESFSDYRRWLRFLRWLQRISTSSCAALISFKNCRYHKRISGIIAGSNSPFHNAWPGISKKDLDTSIEIAGLQVTSYLEVRGDGFWDWLSRGAALSLRFEWFAVNAACKSEAREFFVDRFIYRLESKPVVRPSSVCVVLLADDIGESFEKCLRSVLACHSIVGQVIVVSDSEIRLEQGTVVESGLKPVFCLSAAEIGQHIVLNCAVFLTGNQVVDSRLIHDLIRPIQNQFLRKATIVEADVSSLVERQAPQVVAERYRDLVLGRVMPRSVLAWATNRVEDVLVGISLLSCREAGKNTGQELLSVLEEEGFSLETVGCANVSSTDQSSIAAGKLPHIRISQERALLGHQIDSKDQTRQALSVCMIVRDNEDIVERCLASVAPIADELIVVDTGSVDRTPEICTQFGVKLYHFPWCDDFSAARNHSLDQASGEWVFWIDSDDVLPPDQAKRLRSLACGPHAQSCLGYVMKVHCIGKDRMRSTIVDHVRLIRNRSDVRFEFRIHEQILGSIRRVGGGVEFTDIYVEHFGTSSEGRRGSKLERDLRILNLELQERPDHPFALFNMGMTLEDAGKYSEAADWIQRCIVASEPHESHVPKAYALLLSCLCKLGREHEALGVSDSAVQQFPDDAELQFRRAVLLQNHNRILDAEHAYKRVFELGKQNKFRSLDPAICGGKAHHNLGLIYLDSGRPKQAVEHLTLAIEELPTFGATWVALGKALGRLGDLTSLRVFQRRLMEVDEVPLVSRAIFDAQVSVLEGELMIAANKLETAWKQTKDTECLHELARLAVTHGMYESAFEYLNLLKQVYPADASILFNYGRVAHRLGKLALARSSLRSAVELRPETEHFLVALREVEAACNNDSASTDSDTSRSALK